MSDRPITSFDEFKVMFQLAEASLAPEPDPLLTDPWLSDALAESVRAQLGETVYQLRHAVGEIAA